MNVLEVSGDPEGEASDDLTGMKKSRLKPLKSRLFEKIKKKEDDVGLKQSQSESDITGGVEDLDCSTGMLGSRAFSHDSIFQAEHSHSDAEPLKNLSQENIHGKIRSLQMKLQQQKIHLGPPPLLLPGKRREDVGGSSEDDGLSRSPPEVSHSDGLYMSVLNKASSQPLSPRSISPAPISPQGTAIDFNSPPQVTSLLDNSAARHRMSLKPKNQRASAKIKRVTTSAETRTRSESLNNLDRSVDTRKEEEGQALVKEIPRAWSYSSQVLRPGEKLTASLNKSLPVTPLLPPQTAGDVRQVSSEPELEKNILSTSPTSPSQVEVPPVIKPPIPEVPSDRKGKEVGEMFSSPKLLKSSQSNLVTTARPNVTSTPELSLMKDKKSNTELLQNQVDKVSKQSVPSPVNNEDPQGSFYAPNVICGVNLRPSSFRRNLPSTFEKLESKTLPPVSTVLDVRQDNTQTETVKRQRTVSGSFNVSDKNQERQRTGSFTGIVGKDGLKREATESTKSPLNFKIEWQVGSQVEKMVKDPCDTLPQSSKKEDEADPDPVKPPLIKSIDLIKSSPQALDVEEIHINEKKQEIRVEDTEVHEVEVADEADEDVMEEKERETTNAFGVKLRSTSLSLKFRLDKAQSEDKAKFHSFETNLQAPSVASKSNSTSYVEPDGQRVGSARVHAKLKDCPLQTLQSSNSVQSSGSSVQTFSRDKERTGFLKQTEIQPQASGTKIVPLTLKEDTDLPPVETAASSQETPPISTSSELSWMEMAREKTRSLQQLFTSRLPEFPSLQSRTTTLSTTQTQTSTSQANSKITPNITSQPTVTQPPLRPTESKQLPSAQPSGRSTQSNTQFTPVQTQTRPTTSQNSTNSTTCTSKQPTQSWAPQTSPIQQSSPIRTASQAILRPTPPPGPPNMSSSPKLTSQQPISTVLKDQPENEGTETTIIPEKAERVSMLQGKGSGPEDGRPAWAAGLGNRSSLVQRWENQTTAATKNVEQKTSSESRSTPQSAVPIRPLISKGSGTGLDSSLSAHASGSSVPVKSAEREDKWQQKSPSASPSSSPLPSVRDSGQPSWMELAKRKSLAWSDKTMD